MNSVHTDDGSKGRFFIALNGSVAAAMTYTYVGKERIIIDHTEVSDALRGQQAGKHLLMQVVGFARKNHLKVLPLCPFAKSMFDKLPDIRDVL
jgi:predicted GNAT family acetyltransferase